MVQHSKPTEDLDKAIDDIETAYKQYMASVNKALTIAGCSYTKKDYCLNEIVEHNSLIVTECQRAKDVR